MFNTYQDIFDHRGEAYHQAMSLCPDARAQEFYLAIDAACLSSGDVLCDVPSGGGYLGQYLPQELNLQLIAVDPSPIFSRKSLGGPIRTHLAPLNDLKLTTGSCDAVVSIAGLHHLENRLDVFRELRRVLRPGGRLCILEVAEGSIVDPFLNVFVDAHNSMGHAGAFIDHAFRSELEFAGFLLQRDELLGYTWDFSDEQHMIEFVRLLFGLDKADSDDVLRGISQFLGYHHSASGDCHMNWALQALVCV